MAIAAVFEFPGEPVEKYHKVFEAGEAIVNQPSRLYHVCYRTQTGFAVKLGEQGGHVLFYGAGGDKELRGDLPVG